MEKIKDFEIAEVDLARIWDPESQEIMAFEVDGVQRIWRVSNERLQQYYDAALRLLAEMRWDDACDAFIFLTFLNSDIFNFWYGLGFAQQSATHFEAAILAYSMAQLMLPKNPETYANIYQCLMALEDREGADYYYHQALEKCGDLPEHQELKQKLLQLRA